SERQRLEHVGAAPYAAIEKYRNLFADRGNHLRQGLDGAAPGFRGTAAVIRHQDSVEAVFKAQLRIFMRVDALEYEFAFPVIAHACDEFPVHRRVGSTQPLIVDAIPHWTMAAGLGPALVTRFALLHILGAHAIVSLAEASR